MRQELEQNLACFGDTFSIEGRTARIMPSHPVCVKITGRVSAGADADVPCDDTTTCQQRLDANRVAREGRPAVTSVYSHSICVETVGRVVSGANAELWCDKRIERQRRLDATPVAVEG